MKYVLSLMAALAALSCFPAGADEVGLGISPASRDYVGEVSIRDDRTQSDHKMAVIKEAGVESPEMIAVIENNREDRERQAVIDR